MYVYIYIYDFKYICICLYVYVCVYVLHIYIYIIIYIHNYIDIIYYIYIHPIFIIYLFILRYIIHIQDFGDTYMIYMAIRCHGVNLHTPRLSDAGNQRMCSAWKRYSWWFLVAWLAAARIAKWRRMGWPPQLEDEDV